MAVNKNALIRYKTIDKCLQNNYRKWTLDDLIDACSDALYEYEGKHANVSKRTIQLDIFNMRSDKLGYNAPIIVVDKKYYTYEDKNYSITKLPISTSDLDKLSESVTFLKQFKGFSHFDELNEVIQKLEDHIYAKQTKTKPVIEFEKNEHLKGLEYLDDLYQAIIHKKSVEITYKSFKARHANTFVFHVYLLKEFRNRWFAIGVKDKNKQKNLMNLALDRILDLQKTNVPYIENTTFDLDEHFSKAIGVTVNPNAGTEEIVLFVYNKHAPYVITKPFHPSQKTIDKNNLGITISLNVQHNFELEKEILGLGDGIRVIAPETLKNRIKQRLIYAVDTYQTEITDKNLMSISKQFQYKGNAVVNQIYNLREIKKIHQAFHRYEQAQGIKIATLDDFLTKIPELSDILINPNLQKVLSELHKKAELVKNVFYRKVPQNIIEREWFQVNDDQTFVIRIHLKEPNRFNYLEVMPGSHKKYFSQEEIELLVKNSVPHVTHVRQGGIHLLQNKILRRWVIKYKDQVSNMIELVYQI